MWPQDLVYAVVVTKDCDVVLWQAHLPLARGTGNLGLALSVVLPPTLWVPSMERAAFEERGDSWWRWSTSLY